MFQGDIEPTFILLPSCKQMLQPFKHNVVWAFLAKKLRHQTLLYSGFSGKIGKMEYLKRYFNRLTTSYKCGTWLIKLYQMTMRKKKFDFLFLTTLNHTSDHGHVPTVHGDYFLGDLKGLRTISVILRVYSSREFLFTFYLRSPFKSYQYRVQVQSALLTLSGSWS